MQQYFLLIEIYQLKRRGWTLTNRSRRGNKKTTCFYTVLKEGGVTIDFILFRMEWVAHSLVGGNFFDKQTC